MEVEEIQEVLVFVINRKLAAIKFIESPSLRLEKQAHHQRQDKDMKFFVLINRSGLTFIHVKKFFSYIFSICSQIMLTNILQLCDGLHLKQIVEI